MQFGPLSSPLESIVGLVGPERIPMTPHDILWLAEDVAAAMRSLVLAVG